MTTKTTEAWVLHKQWSGDTSIYVTFFSREFGLIKCLYKGGRAPNKHGLLQVFTPLWISISERYNRFYIQKVENTLPMIHLKGHSLFAGLYVNEILFYVLSPNYSDSSLFNAYLYTLNSLPLNQNRLVLEGLLRRFEWTLLHSCGSSFSLTHEARNGNLIQSDLSYQFIAGEGFVLDSRGFPGAHILALGQDNLNELSYLRSAKLIMRQAINHLIGGREIKTRALFYS